MAACHASRASNGLHQEADEGARRTSQRDVGLGLRVRMTLVSNPNPNRCLRDSDRRDPNPKRTRGIVIVDSASHGCSTPGPRDGDMRSRVTGIQQAFQQ